MVFWNTVSTIILELSIVNFIIVVWHYSNSLVVKLERSFHTKWGLASQDTWPTNTTHFARDNNSERQLF